MRHSPTGRVYIGQHKLPKGKTPETDDYYGSGKIWKCIYKAHQQECVKTILEVVETREEVNELEKKYIAHYRELYGEKCVNITDGGDGGCGTPWNKGKKMSEEFCKKTSDGHKGQTPWNKGKHHSEETKQKIAESLTGKRLSEATRKKMSDARRGEKHHFFGKKFSEEHKQKIAESKMGEKNPNFGKRFSEEHKQKIALANRGKQRSESARQKMSNSHKGKRLSEEQKRKISESLKLYHAKNRKKKS